MKQYNSNLQLPMVSSIRIYYILIFEISMGKYEVSNYLYKLL